MTNVGREYAIALFEAAYEDGSLDAVRDDLTEIRKLLKKEPDYISFLMNPGIPKEERLDSLSEAFENNVEQLLYSFLAVMTTNNHLNEFFTAAKEFEKMYEVAANADYWRILNSHPGDFSYEALKASEPRNELFKAFKEKKVIYCNMKQTPYYEIAPVKPDVLLKDFVAIFHPELVEADYEPTFYYLLK